LKILYVSALYTPNFVGGAERVAQSLAEGSLKAGHQTVVVTGAPQKGVRVERVNGVKVYYVGIKNLYWPHRGSKNPGVLKPLWHGLDTYNALMARELDRILDLERPDLVNTHTIEGFSTLAWRPVKRRGLPLVHTLHEYYLLCPKHTMYRNGRNCQRQCVQCLPYAMPRKRHSNQVDAVVGVSRFLLERHLSFGYFAATPDRRVIYNSYRAEADVPPVDTQSLPIRFGYLGRLDPTKGLETLLQSVAQLSRGTWSLDIGGRGQAAYEDYLRTRYEMPGVRFSGYVRPEVFFPEIDVLVVPSVWHEPSPRVISEAYAYGVPVIGSRRGGIPELIEEDSTGSLFDPDSPDELMQKMQRYVAEPAILRDMRSACLRRAESLLPEKIVEQYLGVYADAVAAR